MQEIPGTSGKYSFPALCDPETLYPDAQQVNIYLEEKDQRVVEIVSEWAKHALNKRFVSYVHDEKKWVQHANLVRYNFWFDAGGSMYGGKAYTSLCDFLEKSKVKINKVIFDDLG